MSKRDAAFALGAFVTARGYTDTAESDTVDLIADLLKLCHTQGEDAEAIARMAVDHFREEAEPHKDRGRTC